MEMAQSKTAVIHNLLKFFIILLAFSFSATGLFAAANQAIESFTNEERQKLLNLFSETQFEEQEMRRIFFDQRLKKMPVVVNRNVNNKELKRNYATFLTPYAIHLANRFARKWRTMLARASRKFGVDREILVAVLLVETGFGNILGCYPIISVYSSIIIENLRQKTCESYQFNDCLDDFSRKRLNRKAIWAEQELKALVTIAKKLERSPYFLRGSYAGAFGIPQFLPSSYLKWGYDSDQNGSVNLFLFPDAIYSTANYLKAHGWQKGLHHSQNRNVIWEYNHSTIYVDTIFKVARQIRVVPPNPAAMQPRKESNQVTLTIQKDRSDNPS